MPKSADLKETNGSEMDVFDGPDTPSVPQLLTCVFQHPNS